MEPSAAAPRRAIEVAAALVFHEGRLLITQRPAGTHLAGLWEFPGGKREPAETWQECLRRELREELEIDTEIGVEFAEIRHDYPEKTVLLRFFAARWTGGQPRAVGCADWRWVTAEELASHEFPPADAVLLQRLREEPHWWQ